MLNKNLKEKKLHQRPKSFFGKKNFVGQLKKGGEIFSITKCRAITVQLILFFRIL
jgi:hypothetical protein